MADFLNKHVLYEYDGNDPIVSGRIQLPPGIYKVSLFTSGSLDGTLKFSESSSSSQSTLLGEGGTALPLDDAAGNSANNSIIIDSAGEFWEFAAGSPSGVCRVVAFLLGQYEQ